MKYYVIRSSNSNVEIESEWDNFEGAKQAYHGLCKVYLNTPEVITGVVAIVDEQLNFIPGYKELITHEAPVTVEEPETPVEE